MTCPPYVREKAECMRRERRLSVNEIAERLDVSKATAYGWVGHIPLQRPRRVVPVSPGQPKGAAAIKRKHQLLREEAYQEGCESYDALCLEPTFRDFVSPYIAEGYKRNRGTVALANSDPAVIRAAVHWMRPLAVRPLVGALQHHADQDPEELRSFWSGVTSIPVESIRLQRKSNSGQLRGRTWRCRHGVLSVNAYDTLLRARLRAWIDLIHEEWLTLVA